MKSAGCRVAVVAMLAMAFVWLGPAQASAQGSRTRAGSPSVRAVTLEARLELMLRTMRIARDWHIEAPSKSVLIAGAIDGLLAKVDPEAELYSRAELRRIARFAVSSNGTGASVGLEVRREPPERRVGRKGYRVVAARDGSPAASLGLKAGDLIKEIEGQPAGEIPYLVMKHVMLDGPPGTRVHLKVERAGTDQGDENVALARTINLAPDVAIDRISPGIHRIRLASLTEDAAAALSRIWAESEQTGSNAQETRGFVIDLRSTAVAGAEGVRAVADAFLQSGPILRTVARRNGARRQVNAQPGDLAGGRPVVVLVDGGTSGGAEMLVSALQEGRRARIVGTKTAGRGALRTLVSLDKSGRKGLLRLTTGRLVTPAGAAIEGKGIEPDVVIEQLPASPRCRTRDIEDETKPGTCVPRTLAQDTQLQRALSLIDEPLMAAQSVVDAPKP